jgi:hypothetical protein
VRLFFACLPEEISMTAPSALTLFSGSAYSLFALSMTLKHYYYWCACRVASPQGEAAGRNLRACDLAI